MDWHEICVCGHKRHFHLGNKGERGCIRCSCTFFKRAKNQLAKPATITSPPDNTDYTPSPEPEPLRW